MHDPQAMSNAKEVLKEKVEYFDDMYEAMLDCDALLILTEWNAYRNLNLSKVKFNLRGMVILDTRNILDSELVKEEGFVYEGVGRR